MTPPPSRRDLARLALVLAVAALVWVAHGGYGKAAAWHRPASYNVDALETLARFQASAEAGASFPFRPVVERLGAPWAADWSSYPMPDAPWYWLVGRLVNAIGLMPASHAALGLAHLLAVAAMFAAARVLGQRPLAAGAVALLFGFAHAISYRGLSHHSFMLAYVAPVALVLAALVARSRVVLRRPAARALCVGAAGAIGAGNPYFIFMTFQLLGFALLWQLLRGRRRANLAVGLACLAACGAVFLALNLPALRAAAAADGEHAFRRNPEEANIYGLRPAELVTPPPRHASRFASRFAEEAARAGPPAGERFSGYLGLAGIAGLLVAFGRGLRTLVRRGLGRYRPGPATVALWILAFATVGGVNAWLARAGFDVFRAGNRYSVYLAAVALLALGAWASRRRARPPLAGAIVATVALGLWDQLPRALPPEAARDIDALVAADRAAAAGLRAALPAGTRVFQLPAPPFPEAGPVGAMSDYEHLRAYLHNPHLRLSYGSMRNTPEARWAARTAELPSGMLVERLAAAGFGAIWVDRRAYPHAAAELLATLGSTGARRLTLAGADHVALFRISPAAAPRLPDPTEIRWHEPWDPAVPARGVSIHAVRGWHPLEAEGGRRWRWAGAGAILGFWNESTLPTRIRVRFSAASLAAGTLEVRHGAQVVSRLALGNEPRPSAEIALELPPGSSALHFAFDGPLIRPPGEGRELGFSLHALAMEPR
ncbi:MAG TPA: hypothetical protein VEB66_03285 [Opitutaceae bacterium]|nr:hypothetical protein [Opitutaceae bacterium]